MHQDVKYSGGCMQEPNLKHRTKDFALQVIRLVRSIHASQEGRILGNQLLRAGTSVGANYRSACRARSTSEFISRLSIANEEADESLYWMELLAETDLVNADDLKKLMSEADQLVAILTSSILTSKRRKISAVNSAFKLHNS